MSTPLTALESPLEARTETVEELVRLVSQGQLRVPCPQRGMKWEPQQVLDLFDSLYRGLPVGALLLCKRSTPATSVRLGPLRIAAPEARQGLWVVDGQQRLTSLAATLARPLPLPRRPVDPFVLYFDPVSATFCSPPDGGELPPEWVPLPLLLYPTRLFEWVERWLQPSEPRLAQKVLNMAWRIRHYSLPVHVAETNDPAVLREMFLRVNETRRRLDWSEVHEGLFEREEPPPATVAQLAEQLARLGMGRLDEPKLTSCVRAIRRREETELPPAAVAEALPVLRRVLSFLRTRAAIPHLRLLPTGPVLEVLSRFFSLHAEPNPRSEELLTRWVWRALLCRRVYEEHLLRRRGIEAVDEDEEGSIQRLLQLLPREHQPVALPDVFEGATTEGQLALLTLASLQPRSLEDGQPLDVAELLEAHGAGAFPCIIPPQAGAPSLARSPANRMLYAGTDALQHELREYVRRHGCEDEVLASHAMSPAAARALADGRLSEFLEARWQSMIEALQRLCGRLAAWGRDRDRPSLSYLLRQADDEP